MSHKRKKWQRAVEIKSILILKNQRKQLKENLYNFSKIGKMNLLNILFWHPQNIPPSPISQENIPELET